VKTPLVENRARADFLVEQARAQPDASPAPLYDSLRLDRDWLNAYFVLAEQASARMSGAELGRWLMQAWEEHGRGSEPARRFVEEFAGGDPYAALRASAGTLPPGALILRLSADLDVLDLLTCEPTERGSALAFLGRVHRPRLLCTMRDLGDFPASKKTIVEALLKRGKNHRVVVHGSTILATDSRVAGPAIDTLHCRRVLTDLVATRDGGLSSVCEIGTGSGLLLCTLLEALAERRPTFVASDVSEHALALTRRNLERAMQSLDRSGRPRPEVRLSDSPTLLSELAPGSVDLLLANPPFVPERRRDRFNACAGTDMMRDILVDSGPRALSPRGQICVLRSSLSAHLFDAYVRKSGLVALPVGEARRVPLDLREVMGDATWLASLRGPGLEETWADPDFTFWHTIQMFCLVRPARATGHGSQPRNGQ